MLWSNQARGPQLLNLGYRAQETCTLGPVLHAREATAMRRLSTATKGSLHSPQPGKSPHSSKDPAEPKLHININIIIYM